MTDLNKERLAFEADQNTTLLFERIEYIAAMNAYMPKFEYADQLIVMQMAERFNFGWSMWQKAKAQAVPEGRTDVEIIRQTIGLVDLIAKSNRFERNKTAALPFESKNPRVKEWWDLACEIQDLLTQTDPNNCDFEEYKDLVASESGAEG
ncbi:hypothetical protein M4D47_12085 [Acinetobacter baumannii]|uniref:hypothetical protein n=1 Tax=Acinetobacter baumannii TaxID=470 RepID=UPI00207C1C80|nr:hypothetical protein [Acinetobacter baumannii]MCO1651860.1 hypothetical protein [Acinetobacter baumannii]